MPLSRSELIASLGDACDRGTAAVFVGAGLSAGAGLPGWVSLLQSSCDDADIPLDSASDLPLVAEYVIAEHHTRDRLEREILDQVSAVGAHPTEQHLLLAQLPVDQIWTTNYDQLLERAATSAEVIVNDGQIQQIGSARQVVIKMHGSIKPGPPPGWASPPVITRSDFENYGTDHPRTWAMLQASYLSKTFLFLGFSFADPNIEVLQRLSRIHGTAAGNRHMAIMRRPSSQEAQKRRFYDLRVRDLEACGVRVHDVDEHDELLPILQSLVRRTRSPRLFISGSDHNATDHVECCHALAVHLADRHHWLLCSLGGPSGWLTTKGVAGIRREERQYLPESLVFHFRRSAAPPPDMDERIGTSVFSDLEREPLVRGLFDDSRAVLVVGGGSRTAEEIEWATAVGAGVVPLAASGGAAHDYWAQFTDAPPALGGRPTSAELWGRLNAPNKDVAARAAVVLLEQAMYFAGTQSGSNSRPNEHDGV